MYAIPNSQNLPKLNSLADVSASAPLNNQVLAYDSALATWKNANAPAGSLAGLSDVQLATATDGQELTYSGSKWVNVPAPKQTIYVNSQTGNDTTGIGTASQPYQTIAKANSKITDAASTKIYAVEIGAGSHSEGAAFKPFVVYRGASTFNSFLNGPMTIDQSFNGGSFYFTGLSFSSGAANMDFSAMTAQCVVRFENCIFNSTTIKGGPVVNLWIKTSLIIGMTVVNSVNMFCYNCASFGSSNFVINNLAASPASKPSVTFYSSSVSSFITATAANTTTGVDITAYGTSFPLGSATLNGPLVKMSSEMIPRTVTLQNGATFVPIGYTTLASCMDATITTPASGNYLTYNGTKWVNAPLVNGTFNPTTSGASNCTNTASSPMYYMQHGNYVSCFWQGTFTTAAMTSSFSFNLSLPVAPSANFANFFQANGGAYANTKTQTTIWTGFVQPNSGASTVSVGMRCTTTNMAAITGFEVYVNFSYVLTA